MILRRPLLISAVLALTVPLYSGNVIAGDAEDFIRSAGQKAFTSLSKELTEKKRKDRFREILLETFDLRVIARFTLGRYWRTASEKQRDDYVELFEDYIVQAYLHRFGDLSGHTFEIKKSQEINARDRLVLSEIKAKKSQPPIRVKSKPPIRINWRVRRRENTYRVIDVVVEGVSMSVTQRDEFAAVIRRNGGKIEGLLSALKRKSSHN